MLGPALAMERIPRQRGWKMFYHSKVILTGSSVLQGEVLILELVAIDGLSSSAVSSGEVATLTEK